MAKITILLVVVATAIAVVSQRTIDDGDAESPVELLLQQFAELRGQLNLMQDRLRNQEKQRSSFEQAQRQSLSELQLQILENRRMLNLTYDRKKQYTNCSIGNCSLGKLL